MRLDIKKNFLEEETRDGFTIPAKMKRSWASQLKLLSMIDDICAAHNLHWYAYSGTLLGAVRHHGFIPWDDDIDICMLREDYERLFELIPQELPPYCHPMRFGSEDNLFRGWSNINNRMNIDAGCDEEERRISEQFYGNPFIDGIDIYPLDYIPTDPDRRRDMLTRYEDILNHLRSDHDLGLEESMILCSQAEDIARSCPREESIGVHNITTMAHCMPDKWHELSWYEEAITVPFEMISVPIPAQYTTVLEQFYGANWYIPQQLPSAHDYPFYARQENYIIDSVVVLAEKHLSDKDYSGGLALVKGSMDIYPDRFELYFTAARILAYVNQSESHKMLCRSYELCPDETIRTKIAAELEKFPK